MGQLSGDRRGPAASRSGCRSDRATPSDGADDLAMAGDLATAGDLAMAGESAGDVEMAGDSAGDPAMAGDSAGDLAMAGDSAGDPAMAGDSAGDPAMAGDSAGDAADAMHTDSGRAEVGTAQATPTRGDRSTRRDRGGHLAVTPPSFWWRADGGVPARLLAPAAAVVSRVSTSRMARAPTLSVAVPVICIGNPTVGGSGKTPVAIAVARVLQDVGASPVFLTRGYRGREPGPVVVAAHDAADVGDEAILLAAVAPTVVARDRAAGGALAAARGDVIVMDDGFQNPGLAKTFALLVIDRAAGIGNGRTLPAGPLRGAWEAHLARADGVVLVAGHERQEAVLPAFGAVPVFTAALEVTAPMALAGVEVVAFAGIGRPAKFFASVERLGARIVASVPFPDHHAYRSKDAAYLLALAREARAQLVTTAKDHVRLTRPALSELSRAAQVIALDARLDAAFTARLADVWRSRR